MSKKIIKKYHKPIENMLGDLVPPEDAKKIMDNLFTDNSLKGYKKGDIMTMEDVYNLKRGDVICIYLLDEGSETRLQDEIYSIDDIEIRENEWDKSKKNMIIHWDKHSYEFEIAMGKNLKEDAFLLTESAGWQLTLYKTIKK